MVDHYPPAKTIPSNEHPKVKIICSGSSSLDIRRKFKDSLVGRKVVFEIMSLSFNEFLTFKNEDALLKLLESAHLTEILQNQFVPPFPASMHANKLRYYLDEYCRYGGYPAVVLESTEDKKLHLLAEIYQAYVRKDLGHLFSIENILAFNQLIQLLALSTGNLINFNTLTSDLHISRPTLNNYVTILENTFIIKRLSLFLSVKNGKSLKCLKFTFWTWA